MESQVDVIRGDNTGCEAAGDWRFSNTGADLNVECIRCPDEHDFRALCAKWCR